MELYAFSFVEKPVADYSKPGTLEKEIDYWEKFLADPKKIGSYGTMYDFYTHGYVRAGGVQFQPATDNGVDWTEVMVKHDCGWYSRYIPSTDYNTIVQFIEKYELNPRGDDKVDFFIKPEIHSVTKK